MELSPNAERNSVPCGVILAGGFGTRLRPLTYQIPKPLLPLFSTTLLGDQLQAMAKVAAPIYVLTHYKASALRKYVKSLRLHNQVRVLQERSPLGTGGALGYLKEKIQRPLYLVFNGDVIHRAPLKEYLDFFSKTGAQGALLAKEVPDASRYGLLQLDRKNRLLAFLEKPQEKRRGWINAGAYLLRWDLLREVPPTSSSIEHDHFPRWALEQKLAAFRYRGYWLDIGTPSSYLQAHLDFLKGKWSPAPSALRNFLRRPAHSFVHKSCALPNASTIGPYAVLYPRSRMEPGASIQKSVILSDCSIGQKAKIAASIVGPRAKIAEGATLQRAVVTGVHS